MLHLIVKNLFAYKCEYLNVFLLGIMVARTQLLTDFKGRIGITAVVVFI
jgi:hypothetical protein